MCCAQTNNPTSMHIVKINDETAMKKKNRTKEIPMSEVISNAYNVTNQVRTKRNPNICGRFGVDSFISNSMDSNKFSIIIEYRK